ncbi:unnamed protein product, partial [Rotaria sp. Silwood2]
MLDERKDHEYDLQCTCGL